MKNKSNRNLLYLIIIIIIIIILILSVLFFIPNITTLIENCEDKKSKNYLKITLDISTTPQPYYNIKFYSQTLKHIVDYGSPDIKSLVKTEHNNNNINYFQYRCALKQIKEMGI